MKKIIPIIAILSLSLAGCVSKTTTASDGTTTTAVDYPATVLKVAQVTAPTLKAAVKIAARQIAAKNPTHITEFQLSAAAVSALFNMADPSAENIKAALLAALPALSATDAGDLADLLAGAWQSVEAQLKSDGVTLSLSAIIANEQYKASVDLLVGAIVEGFSAGVAAATSTSS